MNIKIKSIVLGIAKTIIMAIFMGSFFSLSLSKFSGWSNDWFLFGCFITTGSVLHWKVVHFFFRASKRDIMNAYRVIFSLPGGFNNLAFYPYFGILFYIFAFAFCFKHAGIINAEGVVTKNLSDCLYFSSVTFTTLGYGDFHPLLENRFLACLEALLGYASLGIVVATHIELIRRSPIHSLTPKKAQNKPLE